MKTYVVRNELDRARLIADLKRAPLVIDGALAPITAKIDRWRHKRSLSQNRLMWAWNTICALHVGCTPEEMHEDFCKEINGSVEHVNALTSEIAERVKGTSGFKTHEMAHYLDELQRIAASHLGINLPPPESPEAWDAYMLSGKAA